MKYIYAFLILLLAGPAVAEPTLPDGFVIQVLEPTGGEVARPVDWFYTEAHTDEQWRWIISKEDPNQGPYETGLSIQVFPGKAAGTEWSTEQLARNSIDAVRLASTEVLKECDSSEQEMFERACLEVIEKSDFGTHRVLYTFFWGRNDLDIIAVSVAGTTPEQWQKYTPTFDVMSAIKLIDMNRFPE